MPGQGRSSSAQIRTPPGGTAPRALAFLLCLPPMWPPRLTSVLVGFGPLASALGDTSCQAKRAAQSRCGRLCTARRRKRHPGEPVRASVPGHTTALAAHADTRNGVCRLGVPRRLAGFPRSRADAQSREQ